MPKCPHCGEQVSVGQETCFACGFKVRAGRGRRAKRRVNPLIFVIAGSTLIVLAIVQSAGRHRKAAAEKAAVELARVQDSVRRANQDTAKARPESKDLTKLNADLDEVEKRFNEVDAAVRRGKVTSDQSRLSTSIRFEINRLRQVAASLPLATKMADQQKIMADVTEGIRKVRSMINDFDRAPRAPTRPAATTTTGGKEGTTPSGRKPHVKENGP